MQTVAEFEEQQMNIAFNSCRNQILVQQDLQHELKDKAFKFKNCLLTKRTISNLTHQKFLINSITKLENDTNGIIQLTNMNILNHVIGKQYDEFWSVFSKYQGIAICEIFMVNTALRMKILQTVGFPILLKIMITKIPFNSFEPFAWIDAPNLLDIRVLKCFVTRVNGLDKANFPKLMRLYLAENKFIENQKMSRIRFTKDHSKTDLQFVIADKFFSHQLNEYDPSFFNQEEKFECLKQFNCIKFMVKMQAGNVPETYEYMYLSYENILRHFYGYYFFGGEERALDQVRKFWKKRPLVEVSLMRMNSRLFPQKFKVTKDFYDQISKIVKNRLRGDAINGNG